MAASNDARTAQALDFLGKSTNLTARLGGETTNYKASTAQGKDDLKAYKAFFAPPKHVTATSGPFGTTSRAGAAPLLGGAGSNANTAASVSSKQQGGTPLINDATTGITGTPRDISFAQTKKNFEGVPIVGGLLGNLSDFGKTISDNIAIGDWHPVKDVQEAIVQPQDAAQHPQNVAQWLMNLGAIGTYAGAEAANALGAQAKKSQAAVEAEANKGGGNPALAEAQGIANTTRETFSGIGRGIAEGFGARFDNKRPQTWGQNLEQAGTKTALEGALGKSAGDTAQGALGTVADIGLDPLSWMTLGGGAAVKGALTGGKEAAAASKAAAKAAADAATRKAAGETLTAAEEAAIKNAPKLGTAGARFVGAIKGAHGGAMDRLNQQATDAATASYNKQLRATFRDQMKGLTPLERVKYLQDARLSNAAAARAAGAPLVNEKAILSSVAKDAKAAAKEQKLVPGYGRTPKAPTTPTEVVAQDAVKAADQAVDPRLAKAEALVPDITGRRGNPLIPANQILKDATVGGEAAVPSVAIQTRTNIANAVRTANTPAKWATAAKALKASPGGEGAILARAIRVGDQTMTIGDLARRVAVGVDNPKWEEWSTALDNALGPIGDAVPNGDILDPNALSQGITNAGFGMVHDPATIIPQIQAASSQAAKRNLLIQALGGSGKKVSYKNFDAALKGAVNGEIEHSVMRTMLNRLGIRSGLTDTPQHLRSLLSGRGMTKWEDIKGSVKTTQEVLDVHGVDDAAFAESKTIDAEAAMAAAEAHVAQAVTGTLGYDARKIGPLKQTRDSVGAGLFKAQEISGDLARKGNMTEALDNDYLTNANKAIMQEATQHSTMAMQGGAERAAALHDTVAKTWELNDAANLARGAMPRLVNRYDSDALHVGWSQVIQYMDRNAFDAAFISPAINRATREAEKTQGFTGGFTLYPNVVADGIRAAVRGGSTESVAQFIIDGMNRISKGKIKNGMPNFKEAAAQVAAAITDPEFISHMNRLHADQEPIALALSQRAADGIVQPLTGRIIEAINDGADRGKLQQILDDARTQAKEDAKNAAGYPSLLSDSVQARVDNAYINGVLGEWGSLLLNADERALKASKVRASAKGGAKQYEKITPAAELKAQNAVKRENLADVETLARDSAFDPAHASPEEHLEDVMTFHDMLHEQNGLSRLSMRMGVALEGKYGMQFFKDHATNEQTLSYLAASNYNQALRRWAHGGRLRAFGQKTDGVNARLGETLGLNRPATYEEVTQKVNEWWNALAATPEGATDAEVRAALAAGRPFNARVAGADTAVPGVHASEIDMAMELRQMIDQVFDESGRGMFSRAGLDVRDVTDSLKRYKTFQSGGAYAEHLPSGSESLATQANVWRQFGEADDKLNLLDQYFTAMSAASVKPSLGATVSHLYGFKNPTAEEKAKLGLARLNTTSEKADFARYLDPEAYFTPADIKQMTYLQNLLNATKQFPQGIAPIVHAYDAVTRVLKSSATIWRPGHHITNILGDMGMNLMAGVTPANYIRGMKTIEAGMQLGNIDMGPVSELARLLPGAGQQLGEKFTGDAVLVNVGGKIQPVSLGDLWVEAQRRGVAMNHSSAQDILGDVASRYNRTTGETIRRATGLPQANEALGRFSAVRDNVTRIPHFIHALEKGQFSSLDQAFEKAAAEVHDYHPTSLNVSAFEQKYLRRAFYFYTWTRQAASRIIRTAFDKPGLITIPSKAQYNMAQANGLNPDSIGIPIDESNPDIASYNATSLLGPTYFGGLAPFDQGTNLWGYSLSSPQIDTLNTLAAGANTVPGDTPIENVGNVVSGGARNAILGSLNPLLTVPGELTFNRQVTGTQTDIKDPGKFLFDQSGVPATIAKMTGAYGAMFPASLKYKTPEEQAGDKARAEANFWTGMKFTDYSGPTSAAVAKKELLANKTRMVKKYGKGYNQ